MEILLGVFVGYLTITICESIFHREIYHARPSTRKAFARLGVLGRTAQNAWFQHHFVHHYLTFKKNHVTQFSTPEEKNKVDNFLHKKGRQKIIFQSYGARIGNNWLDYLLYMGPTLPFFATVCWIGGVDFFVGALIPLAIWPALAQFVHPFTHTDKATLQRSAPLWMKYFSHTKYFKFLVVHHWLHHKYGDCNYNLLLGGDFLLGVSRSPSVSDLCEMRLLGLIDT